MKKLLDYALEYVARGWWIFPVREKDGMIWQDEKGELHPAPKAKTPYIKFGVNGASNDPAQIRQWWAKWPNAAIGCNMGKSGLFALDLDRKDGRNGWEYYRDHMRDCFSDEGAFHSTTPSGGIHIIFSGDGKPSTNTEIGLDTRGRNSYIILPPSEIEGKGDYFQCDDWSGTPAPIPAGLLNYLFPPIAPKQENEKNYPSDPNRDYELAQKAIHAISVSRAQNYDDKVRIGMALARLGGDGLTLWKEFCSRDMRPGKYDAGEIERHWERIKNSNITLATLFWYANQDTPGWRNI